MRSAALLLLALALACGGSQGGGSAPAPADSGGDEPADRPADPPSNGKGGGWRWKGAHDDCFFVVKNHCFDKQADACAAAGCPDSGCTVTGGGPATVSCRK
ncbi:MAG TPA: hypothetical protein VL172_08385 [Kofleriaceae bacterium]|jgi:hypothetical protein|nr:hypothetical protein [Kofleriaceae bacterium]